MALCTVYAQDDDRPLHPFQRDGAGRAHFSVVFLASCSATPLSIHSSTTIEFVWRLSAAMRLRAFTTVGGRENMIYSSLRPHVGRQFRIDSTNQGGQARAAEGRSRVRERHAEGNRSNDECSKAHGAGTDDSRECIVY